MTDPASTLKVSDRAVIRLDSKSWRNAGWFEGTVVRIDPYSAHRSFYWVELDVEVEPAGGGRTRLVSVFNPRHIVRL
jgi:hypothetical protein